MNELKYTCFDLEQRILDCWSIVDEIALMSATIGENGLSDDSIMNVLNGLETLYTIKFNRLFECYDELTMDLVKNNKMLEEECAALREQLTNNNGAGGEPTNQGAGLGMRPTLFGRLHSSGNGVGVETDNFKPVPIIKSNKK